MNDYVKERVELGMKILDGAKEVYECDEISVALIADVVSELMHVCDALGLSWYEDILSSAEKFYRKEKVNE